MTRRNAISAIERRALADALRHMNVAGVSRGELSSVAKLTAWKTSRAVSFPVTLPALSQAKSMPGRDDIGGSLAAGVVSPRHDDSSVAGDSDLPVDLTGGSGAAAPVIFLGAQPVEGVDGVEQRGAGNRGVGLGHGPVVARATLGCHGAGKGRSVP